MKARLFLLMALVGGASVSFAADKVTELPKKSAVQNTVMSGERLSVSADVVAADRQTGAVTAKGHVHAKMEPFHLYSDEFSRGNDQTWHFSQPTSVTTCSNDFEHVHWRASGELIYATDDFILAKNVWARVFDVPVLWLPLWYYPLNTDYGWRVMPGYTSRWGAYLMTKYVYNLYGDFNEEGTFALGASSRLDLRTENGLALGQGFKWQLGDFGRGAFKIYYAWDDDFDHYKRHWQDGHKWNYQNWGSPIDRDRYILTFDHIWNPTERDRLWVDASYVSDSSFYSDFLRNKVFGTKNVYLLMSTSEFNWEHQESAYAMGLTVSGQLNDFYGGIGRLPEAYVDFNPTPVWGTPFIYEMSTRAGLLNRNYQKNGVSSTGIPYRYNPGPWADYQTFRFDTYHRLTWPMRFANLLSVVPRIGYHGTFWDDSAYAPAPAERAPRIGDSVFRSIIEGGVTFAAKGRADFEGLTHLVEPYLDVLAQESYLTGLKKGAKPYVFDTIDSSFEWLDQFAGRSRNLPYSWYGITPGLRNTFRFKNEKGETVSWLDADIYCSIQFNHASLGAGTRGQQMPTDYEDPFYGDDDVVAVPGIRVRWKPQSKTAFSARFEYDSEHDTLAYGNLTWSQVLTERLNMNVSYVRRSHRWWDFGATFRDSSVYNDSFNWPRISFVELEFEHEICDWLAWGPYIQWDAVEGELDEIGTWIDYRTDCLGFRFILSYENDYQRIDGSYAEDDWRFGFMLYLRALGPAGSMPSFGD